MKSVPALEDTWQVSRESSQEGKGPGDEGKWGDIEGERERKKRDGGSGNKERERSRERNEGSWDFPGSPVVKTPHFQCGRLWVQALVGELRTHMLCRATKRNEKKENRRREGKDK